MPYTQDYQDYSPELEGGQSTPEVSELVILRVTDIDTAVGGLLKAFTDNFGQFLPPEPTTETSAAGVELAKTVSFEAPPVYRDTAAPLEAQANQNVYDDSLTEAENKKRRLELAMRELENIDDV